MDGLLDGLFDGTLEVRGGLGRKLNNALKMSFRTGPETEIATAVQSGGDGAGRKLGVLFGFKNGGPGTHVVTAASGAEIHVVSREQEPTSFLTGDGTPIGEARRVVYGTKPDDVDGNASTVHDPDGNLVFRVVPHAGGAIVPPDSKAPDRYRTDLVDATGAVCGALDLIRVDAGWSLGRQVLDDVLWFGRAGQSLPMPVVGTALAFNRQPTALEGNLAMGMCVDVSIGLRPYITEMN